MAICELKRDVPCVSRPSLRAARPRPAAPRRSPTDPRGRPGAPLARPPLPFFLTAWRRAPLPRPRPVRLLTRYWLCVTPSQPFSDGEEESVCVTGGPWLSECCSSSWQAGARCAIGGGGPARSPAASSAPPSAALPAAAPSTTPRSLHVT